MTFLAIQFVQSKPGEKFITKPLGQRAHQKIDAVKQTPNRIRPVGPMPKTTDPKSNQDLRNPTRRRNRRASSGVYR